MLLALSQSLSIVNFMRYSHTAGKEATVDQQLEDPTRRSTMRMCRYVSETDPPCFGPYRWHLSGDSGTYVVCDAHLALAIRSCDLPARIDRPHDSDDVLNVKFVSKRNPLPKP